MVRTKHALIFVVSFLVLLVALVVGAKVVPQSTDSASRTDSENLFVMETPVSTVREQAPKDTKGIRESFLAKMKSREQSASVIESAEQAPEEPIVSEPEVTEEVVPTEEKFDWTLWMARIPEFEEKQMQYGVNVQNVKDSLVQITLKNNTLNAKLLGDTASITPETLTELTKQKACFESLISLGQNLITTLEGSDAAPLGLLYSVLIKDIRAQYAESNVTELYTQSVTTEARNATLLSDYGTKSTQCDGPID